MNRLRAWLDCQSRYWQASHLYNDTIEKYQQTIQELQAERDALKKDNLILLDRIHGIEAERDSLRTQAEEVQAHTMTVIEHRNSLQARLNEALKANERLTKTLATGEIKQSRTRKKPLAKAE